MALICIRTLDDPYRIDYSSRLVIRVETQFPPGASKGRESDGPVKSIRVEANDSLAGKRNKKITEINRNHD